ncbi:uncharacterized protein LOC132911744 isoform X1 [Bombus pascuorum]|uniref:Uncharacterized protein LOC100742137 isoform X1 n=1 Tax=Bombus impatiens TaxID=132113 RepID=A0A6P3UN03_BOMIM|nr:uncharacterized protein LOC100742137 isoform X1 [Bombus impatiens]XP_060824607.1 uncharacterized protein LOC132911744 isoform X1 [Bombus pascuorum]
MRGRISVFCAAMVATVMLCSRSSGQVYAGTDWLRGLHENIGALNRNIQHNVMQLNQRIQETVQANSAQIHRVTEKLNEELAHGPASVHKIGGNNVIISNNDGMKIVHSGRTSDGKPYVRESTDKIVGDILRHVERIYDPTMNTSKVLGYTLDLKDPDAKPIPISEFA